MTSSTADQITDATVVSEQAAPAAPAAPVFEPITLQVSHNWLSVSATGELTAMDTNVVNQLADAKEHTDNNLARVVRAVWNASSATTLNSIHKELMEFLSDPILRQHAAAYFEKYGIKTSPELTDPMQPTAPAAPTVQ